MNRNRSQTTILVTGAAGEIGAYLASRFSKIEGVCVLATCRNAHADRLDQLREYGDVLSSIDLCVEADLCALRDWVFQRRGGRLVVLHCAGAFPGFASMGELTVEAAVGTLLANVGTLYGVCHALGPTAFQQDGGSFVAFGSHAAASAFPLTAAFSAAKVALESLVRSIANEFGGRGISANTLALATVDTPQERALRPNARCDEWLSLDQVYGAASALALNPCAFLTGTTVHVYNYSESFFGESYYSRLGLPGGLS